MEPTVHIKTFNDRVKVMNQTQGKDLVLTASDARNLQSDIFNMLSLVAQLTSELHEKQNNELTLQVEVDGGKF